MSEIDAPQETPDGTEPSRSPLYCVYCGKQHPDDVSFCPITGKPLDRATWIRDAPGSDQSAPEAAEQVSASFSPEQSTGPQEMVPPLPELPKRAEDEPIATYLKGWRILIPEMGDRADEIAARFFAVLAGRAVKGLRLSLGKLIIRLDDQRSDSRDYYFAEHDLGNGALATMTVRIAPFGRDLFVEWRHYVTPGMTTGFSNASAWGVGGIAYIIMLVVGFSWLGFLGAILFGFVGLLFAVLIGALAGEVIREPQRMAALEGFQSQESMALQLSVSAALEKAIDLAGISKELIQEWPKDGDRRVI